MACLTPRSVDAIARCRWAQDYSRWLSDYLTAGERCGYFPGEEGITDRLVIDFRALPTATALVIPVPKRTEGRIGADWIWLFLGGTTWFALVVQAKRYVRGAFPRVNTLVGRPRLRQSERLISTATSLGSAAAVYVFYFHPPTPVPTRRARCGLSLPTEQWSCLVAPARVVQALGTGRQPAAQRRSVEKYSFPLACLFCCPPDTSGSLVESAAYFAERLAHVEAQRSIGTDLALPDDSWRVRVGRLPLPDELEQAARGDVERLAAMHPNVAGMVVFESNPK